MNDVRSPSPLPDREARNTIVSRFDLNLLVEASAGSGKTHNLVLRMAAGIADGTYEVDGMAAVTFTRKAAAELRGRFQQALEDRLREEHDGSRIGRIQQALFRLERFFAGTIHAFCAHLLRERPVEAEVAPGFAELDEWADADLQGRCWRDYWARGRASGSPLLRELEEAGIHAPDLDGAFRKVCLFEEVEFPVSEATAPDAAEGWLALARFWTELERLLPTTIDRETTCAIQRAAREYRWRVRAAEPGRAADLASLLTLWEGNLKPVQKWWASDPAAKRAIKAELLRLLGNFQSSNVDPYLSRWRIYVHRLATHTLTEARDSARKARFDALTLNYADLLQATARVLRERADVRRALQRKYRWLFVDEFQDTDPVQAELILLLASQPGDPEQTTAEPLDWRQVMLRPGSLFIVGDPKQSIYRFRRADIEIYDQVRDIVERGGGERVELVASFRAVPALCGWANEVFKYVFPAEPTPEQPAFHGLKPVRAVPEDETTPADERLPTGVRVLTCDSAIGRKDVCGQDAARIASYIRAGIDDGRRSARDFLILTWKKKDLNTYATALEDRRIQVEVSGAGAFGDSVQVQRLADLLRALSDPDDGVALVGVLRGPLFGVSDEALFSYRQGGGRFRLGPWLDEDAESEATDDPTSVASALCALWRMCRWTRELPIASAVERILESTGYLALAAATPGGAEAGDLLHAIDRVRRVAENGGTLAEAADDLDRQVDESEVESPPLESGRGDVVRVMNLHQAKGLEAPVVFLADPCGGYPIKPDIRIARDGDRAVGFFQITRGFGHTQVVLGSPLNWDAHAATEQVFLEKEADRLRYVAATRARDLLVISRYEGKKRDSDPWISFDPYLADAPELESPPQADPAPAAQESSLSAAGSADAARQREKWLDEARSPSWLVESVTGAEAHGVPVREDDPARLLRGPATGMAWGELVHKLLEHAFRRGEADREHLERLARWRTFGRTEIDEVVTEAVDTVEQVAASNVWRRAMASSERHVEIPFSTLTLDSDGAKQVRHGVIDLVYKTDDGWEILDHKTDQIPSAGGEQLVERYADQLGAYADAWTAITQDEPARVGVNVIRERLSHWVDT